MKIKTSELTGKALDWAVAKIEGWAFSKNRLYKDPISIDLKSFSPSSEWSQGGPIIERERVELSGSIGYPWCAQIYSGGHVWYNASGNTPLKAAMRCYVASKLGSDVDVPDELIGDWT